MLRYSSLIIAATLLILTLPAPLTAQDDGMPEAAVEGTVVAFFDALEASDYDSLRAVVTADFELVEDTAIMSTDEFVSFAKSFREGGTTLTWKLGDFNTEIRRSVAWTRYRNRGRMTSPDGAVTRLEWLESAVLVKVDGQWKIDRLHSTPIAD